jgi:hypothetical protein
LQNRFANRRIRFMAVTLAIGAAAFGWGCGSGERTRGSSPSAGGHAGQRGGEPAAIVVASDNFVDTDGNGYRDTTSVIIYVFSQERAVPTSADGTFSFMLESIGGEPIVHWRFDRQQSAAALRQLAPGPAYVFELSLFDATRPDGVRTSDRLSISEADLLVTFTPAVAEGQQARPLRGRPGAPLLVGPRMRARPAAPPSPASGTN